MIFSSIKELSINSVGKVYCRPDWVWDVRKGFVDFDLWFVLGGRGTLIMPDRELAVAGGDCFLFRRGMTLFGRNEEEAPLTVIYCHFHYVPNGQQVFDADAGMPALYRKIPDRFFLTGLLHRMLNCYYRQKNDDAAGWLMAALQEIQQSDQQQEPGNFNRASELIRTINSAINEHPERDFSLKKLARQFSCCPEHFSRLYKQHTGNCFRDEIINARLRRAKFLLESTGYPISEIASILGYKDIYLFSKQFKKHVGISPSAYAGRKPSQSRKNGS